MSYVPQKKAENMQNSYLGTKNSILQENFFILKNLIFALKGPPFRYFQQRLMILKKKIQKNRIFWDMSNIERNKVKKFGNPSLWKRQTIFGDPGRK